MPAGRELADARGQIVRRSPAEFSRASSLPRMPGISTTLPSPRSGRALRATAQGEVAQARVAMLAEELDQPLPLLGGRLADHVREDVDVDAAQPIQDIRVVGHGSSEGRVLDRGQLVAGRPRVLAEVLRRLTADLASADPS